MTLLGLGGLALVAQGDPQLPANAFRVAMTLAAVGLGAQLLSFNTTRAAAGSIALIPFSAALLVAPHRITVVAVVAAELGVQLLHRRALLKSLFNVAQTILGASAGVLAYRVAVGSRIVALGDISFFEAASVGLVPAALLAAAMQLVNSVSVSSAIAVTTKKPLVTTWSQITRVTLRFSGLIVVLAFYLAWLSVNLGIMGTLGLLLPMLAVRQLYRSAVELRNVTEELLDLMVAAIEARDPYTSGHSQRVARGSEIIARALGLGAAEVERIAVAALLHDVGKIDERFAPILAKEGRLTPEEWATMKEHPIRSAELVGKLSSLRDVVAPVRHHHENWDGTGYPDGLIGDRIPLASRIIMFADTLDAITTDRPYRKALGLEEARSEFLRFKGRQFDPVICERVVSMEVWGELYTCFGGKSALKEPAAVAS